LPMPLPVSSRHPGAGAMPGSGRLPGRNSSQPHHGSCGGPDVPHNDRQGRSARTKGEYFGASAILMRVAILSTAAELGGAERSLLTFLKAAQGRMIDAMVLLPREGPLADALTALDVPWEIVPMPGPLLSQSRQERVRLDRLHQLLTQVPGYFFHLLRALRRIKPAVL